MKIGLDIGSTTLKCVALDESGNICYKSYERHFSRITSKAVEMLHKLKEKFPDDKKIDICISGSAGMGLADSCHIPFVQEVYATRIAVTKLLPGTDAVIELGGEDAKILFLSEERKNSDGESSMVSGGLEVRMNGSCAGGTGAFIDQMATLLNIPIEEMNDYAKEHEKIYTIASRCGVFAKSDIQPLLNQGAKKSDIAASIFVAVVNQTIAGLAQGREIKGNVVYLGGPLSFFSELRESFDRILDLKGTCPDNSLYFVAMGAAYSPSSKTFDIDDIIAKIENFKTTDGYISCEPLFKSQEEYDEFNERHNKDKIETVDNEDYEGDVYLGIDAGSTTVKAVVIDKDENILTSEYLPNSGNPVPIIKSFLEILYKKYTKIKIAKTCVTGYGEEIIKNAFSLDYGIVETVAHFTAAKKFRPNVDFIIDIGGQDIKCFKIRNGAIDNIFLNEACSSGCGSFLQTFAGAWGTSISDFAKMGLFADRPVDLGSRCTVFMNSSVKQAQKEGASIENISAGLSISVVKNALYKVIRATSADALGDNIVVQGGTFLNDAVLRAFEKEIKKDVVRPNISGLMGAYGSALYAKSHAGNGESTIINAEQLANFKHEVKAITCKGCSNNCKLTINTFDGGRKYIGGNRCEKPLAKAEAKEHYDMYEYKTELLSKYVSVPGERGKIGIPMGLNMYELLPFWHTLFTKLKFEVVVSPKSTRSLYISGQSTIPSDTVCYPAKLMHGHVKALIDSGIRTIFYPCMTYNFDERLGDNHYNCPVVAYYPEVIRANIQELKRITFTSDYLGLHRKRDFTNKMYKSLTENGYNVSKEEVKEAVIAAYNEYYRYMGLIRQKGKEFLELAKEKDLPVIVLVGRPYHLDPEINHGIDRLICDCGAVVVSEDSISDLVTKFPTTVLNQWTYHSRMYAGAKFVADSNNKNINLVQLVSFGCGVDAITTDEIRSILERSDKIYTQIKIDEITNLGAVKIRLRSLFAALEQEKEK